STTRSPRVTTPPRPQVAPSTSPHPHPASWIRVAPSASGYLDPRRPIHIRLPRYFVADRFFGGSRRCAGVAEVPTFTQASESHQRRITEAILEHALKICSDKNVRGWLNETWLWGIPRRRSARWRPNSRPICSSWGAVLSAPSRGCSWVV
uniref:Uncharacterized protein n=1 Tax=Aegilops tauschii subsp. strangulata TaxID=200361 RepID=A0A453RNE9_AEGTS